MSAKRVMAHSICMFSTLAGIGGLWLGSGVLSGAEGMLPWRT